MNGIGDLVATLGVNSAMWSSGLNKASGDLKAFATSTAATLSSVTSLVAGAFGVGVSLRAADEDIRAGQRLQAVLTATGGAAGLTAAQIGAYASELQRTTNFGDEVTVQAAAILATFKNLNGGTFKETLALAQDLAELKQIGLTEAATALGKALNSPAEGLAKLSKMGIQFTDSQVAQIKAMEKAGNAAGAQAVMIKALQDTIGGAAEAAASPLTQIQNYIGDIGEEIGKKLLPFMRNLATLAKDFLPKWGPWIAQAVIAAIGLGAALKTVAVTQAFIQGISGPKGWLALAAGIAVATASVMAFESALVDAQDKSRASARDFSAFSGASPGDSPEAGSVAANWTKKVEQARKILREGNVISGAEKTRLEITAISSAFNTLYEDAKKAGASTSELANFEFRKQDLIAKTVDKFTGFSEKLRDVNNEIRILKGVATQAGIELEKMSEAGFTPSMIARMKEAFAERDRLKAIEREHDNVTQRETKNAEIRKRMMDSSKGPQSTAVGALQKGSADAVSAVLKAMRGDEDKIQKEQLNELQNLNEQFSIVVDHTAAMANGGGVMVAGGL